MLVGRHLRLVVKIVACLVLVSCDYLHEPSPCLCQEVIDIKPQHMTRAYFTLKCSDGRQKIQSLHWSNNLACHGKMYHAGDYLPAYGNKVFENEDDDE